MLLFEKRFHDGLVSGAIDLTFRAWTRPRVKPGNRYRCHPIGVLQVDDVREVRVADITDAEAARAGFTDRAELLTYLQRFAKQPLDDDADLYRVALHHAGEADFTDEAAEPLTGEAAAEMRARLERMDRRSRHGPWTFQTLRLIAAHPRTVASKLARKVGRETAPFKADVRKLKKLGLTMSFEVGYDLTPRGRALLDDAGR